MDLSLTVARKGPYQAQQNKDTIAVGTGILEIMAEWYLPLSYTIDELAYCPALRSIDELKALPLTTVIAGSCEVLLGDSIFIADALRRAGTPMQLVVLEGQTHNYLVYDELSKDGVFVPELIGRIVTRQPIKTMVGTDGFGLMVNAFNINE
jgi:acetyl esterase/lipase